MDRSDNYDALVDALLDGRATADETARLLGEDAGEELEQLAELVDTLARIDPGSTAPTDAEFSAARKSVLDRISADEAAAKPHPRTRWLPLAAALVAFAIGLAIGKGSATPATAPATLIDLVARSALAGDLETSFRYSNLRLEEVDVDTLELSVDVAAELDLQRPKDDPLVNEILASSLLNETSLGARLKAVRHAGRSPRVQHALIAAALNDLDMSVRLKALERLIEQDPASQQTQEMLLAVVENEESVVMRLLALDALADDYIDDELLDTLDGEPALDGESAVRWRARQRLNRRSL